VDTYGTRSVSGEDHPTRQRHSPAALTRGLQHFAISRFKRTPGQFRVPSSWLTTLLSAERAIPWKNSTNNGSQLCRRAPRCPGLRIDKRPMNPAFTSVLKHHACARGGVAHGERRSTGSSEGSGVAAEARSAGRGRAAGPGLALQTWSNKDDLLLVMPRTGPLRCGTGTFNSAGGG
jgi:hypothetical protein